MKKEKVKSFVCFINVCCVFIYGLGLVNGRIMEDAPFIIQVVPIIIMFAIQFWCERGKKE